MNAKDVMSAYFDAWRAHDGDALRSLLADDADFVGPLGRADGADECRRAVERLFEITTDVDIKVMTVERDDVLTWFELHTSVAAPTAVVNWSQVREGKIARIRASFDPWGILAGGS